MSNDITYSLTFRATKRQTLLEVKRYLAKKKDRWAVERRQRAIENSIASRQAPGRCRTETYGGANF
jgi:hypothetical protein